MIEEMKNRYATYDEISKMYFSEKDLAFIDYGDEEIVGYCSDLPDIIVDINRKLGTRDIKVYSFETNILSGYNGTKGVKGKLKM